MRSQLHHHVLRAGILMALVATAAGLLGGTAHSMHARAQRTRQACAAALGTYIVGMGATPRSGVGAAVFPAPLSGALSGTITLSGAPSCGAGVAGSFSVHYSAERAPVVQPRGSSSRTAMIVPAPIVGTTVLTATGSFTADAAHPRDPMYVSVSGTVTYGGVASACYRFCPQQGSGAAIACPQAGCGASAPTVTSTVSFSGVTGYLRLRTGTVATLVLAFLPPPDSAAATPDAAAFQALVLSGRRTGS